MTSTRKIVHIIEEKCTGCGECLPACHEGAIRLVDGKARLLADKLCDGLGDCLKECPFGALQVIERAADPYDEVAVHAHLSAINATSEQYTSGLKQWPVQLHLVPTTADYFHQADLLISATCVAVASPRYQQDILQNKAVVVACPKLDNTAPYATKLAEIIKNNSLRTITIAKMEVPCCNGLTRLVQEAQTLAGSQVPVTTLTITTKGQLLP